MSITSEADANILIATSKIPVIIDFYADWCGPCKMLSPILESLKPQYEGKLEIIKVDVDASPNLSQSYGVVSIPTIVIIKDGNEVDRIIGFNSKESLEAKFNAVAA